MKILVTGVLGVIGSKLEEILMTISDATSESSGRLSR